MPMKRRLRGRSAMREEGKSHRCRKSRGGWRWEQRSRKKQRNLKHGIMQSRREIRKRLTWKEDAQSEESSAQYEELPVHSDEDFEESFREEEAGEPPVQLEEDSQTWDSDWTRQFQNMADASERQGADDREVRKIMEQCISLYLNEKERNKLYHWKDILEEPAYRDYYGYHPDAAVYFLCQDMSSLAHDASWGRLTWVPGAYSVGGSES